MENKIEYSRLYSMLFDSNGNFVRQLVKVKIDEDGNYMFDLPKMERKSSKLADLETEIEEN